jgi:spore germination cell wall hydrolase CwlJ-like protein
MITQFNTKVLISILFLFLGLMVMPKSVSNSEVLPVPAIPHIDVKQLQCMAKNIFYEAGSESVLGQAAVARVVLNRIQHGFAKTPCAVIYQSTTVDDSKICQFSWVCEGKGEPNTNSQRYKVAQQVAYDVMVHDKYKDVIPRSILFFHNLTVTPLWPYAEAMRIGNHIFYARAKKKTIKPSKRSKA